MHNQFVDDSRDVGWGADYEYDLVHVRFVGAAGRFCWYGNLELEYCKQVESAVRDVQSHNIAAVVAVVDVLGSRCVLMDDEHRSRSQWAIGGRTTQYSVDQLTVALVGHLSLVVADSFASEIAERAVQARGLRALEIVLALTEQVRYHHQPHV